MKTDTSMNITIKSSNVQQAHGTKHTTECASGRRAEERGPCDCGAVMTMPFRMRTVRDDASGDDRIEMHIDKPLNTSDAMTLALTLQDFAIKTSHANIVRRERAEKIKERTRGGE